MLNTDYEIVGPDHQLAQDWVATFHGLQGVSARKCKAAHLSMRLGPRNWTQIHVSSPTGESTQLFVSPDKNRQQVSTEICSQKVADLVRAQVGNRHGPVDAARREGIIFLNWIPLCHVVPAMSGALALKWNPELLTATQIDKELIARTMEESAASKGAGKGAALRSTMEGIAWIS